MRFVKRAAYLTGHTVAITFDDDVTKLVDFAPHLQGEIFAPLLDPAYFVGFSVNPDTETITWPNGADFSPEWLYEIGQEIPSLSHSA
ncbi:MAG TPA: DUF2442 domain-containing protein [Phycisphaerae bacterium]|nr:DUF2442 domain-containing protein [Phycisphaerae bacterium]